jgi:hypothetical protein
VFDKSLKAGCGEGRVIGNDINGHHFLAEKTQTLSSGSA